MTHLQGRMGATRMPACERRVIQAGMSLASEEGMGHHTSSARAALTTIALTALVLAQAPRTPDEPPPVFERSQDTPRSKTDAYRFVGKVVAVDREKGMVTLSTEEGERVLKA